ncbi:MAG: hypothetical protein AB7L13_01640 [Acidimicrobiia bacterium]
MIELEEVVVGVDEAIRMLGQDSAPHDRLALIILDNAAEVMLARRIRQLTIFNDINRRMLSEIEDRLAEGFLATPEIAKLRERLTREVVSQTQLRKMDASFHKKLDFLVKHDVITSLQSRSLARLHEYRNEVFHRDKRTRSSVKLACRLFVDLICSLVESYQPLATLLVPAPTIARYLNRAHEDYLVGFAAKDSLARALRNATSVDDVSMGSFLSEELRTRLDRVDRDLEFVRQVIFPELCSDDPLSVLQADLSQNPSLDDVRSQEFPCSVNALGIWRQRSTDLAEMRDRYELFATFAELEILLEDIEDCLKKAVAEAETIVQAEVDRRRGK